MLLELVQLELDNPESFQPAIGTRRSRFNVGGNFGPGFGDGLNQQMDILMGVLDAVERRLQGSFQVASTLPQQKYGGEGGI